MEIYHFCQYFDFTDFFKKMCFFLISDPNQKTMIICDEKLKAVTKKKKVMCKEIMTYLQKHMTAIK